MAELYYFCFSLHVMKKILIISYYWPPSGGAGVQRWLKFTKYLPEFGIQPVVLTVDPAQASYAQRDESLLAEVHPATEVHYSDTFELYNVYLRLTGKKEIPYGGFANTGKESMVQRLAKAVRGNFFLPDPRRGWNRHAFRKAVELIRQHGIETVVTTSPPHSTQLIGLKLKQKLGICWVADMRDPWTDIYYYNELYHSLPARRLDRAMEQKVLSHADRVITVSQDMKRIFTEKLSPAAAAKITVIPNGYDEDDFAQPAAQAGDSGQFIISYTGTISEAYHMDGFLTAVAALPEEQQSKIRLRFVGQVPPSIVARLKQALPLVTLELVGYVDHLKSVAYLLASSMQLLIIPKVENNKGIVTGKFFEYLASGKPVLAIGPREGDLDRMIGETKCGQLFDYDEAESMQRFIGQWMAGETRQKGRNQASAYSRRGLTQSLVEKLFPGV